MNRFRKSDLEFLVATDVAARGIDVENIEVVFNYDLPYDGEDYVHRVGRTGRQGRSGRAISFASGREVYQIRAIERYVNTRIHRAIAPTIDEVEAARANVVLDKVRATLKRGEFKRQDQLIERLLEEGFSSTDIASALLHHLQGGESAPAAQGARLEGKPLREPRAVEETRPRVRSEGRGPEERGAGRPAYSQAGRLRHERPAQGAREGRSGPYEERPPRSREEPSQRRERPPAPEPRKVTVPALVKESPGPAKPPTPEAPPPTPDAPRRTTPAPVQAPKASRRTPDGQTRLYVNAGAEMGVSETDIIGTILGATGLPRKVIGAVDIRDRHLFVDVASEHANSIIAKLNRAQIKGRNAKVKVA
jgi:ATP-dependent RNA helicase DeaD